MFKYKELSILAAFQPAVPRYKSFANLKSVVNNEFKSFEKREEKGS